MSSPAAGRSNTPTTPIPTSTTPPSRSSRWRPSATIRNAKAKGIDEAISPRRRLADRHAKPGRRLGRLRQGQRQEAPDQDPVLRFRRGARSALGRRDRACRRGVRQARAFRASIRRWSARSIGSGASRRRTAPWFGRWGVNYVYGTAAALPALAAIGEDMTQAPYVGARLRLAGGASAGRRRLGRELRLLYGHRRGRSAAPPPPRRPPGR